VHVDAQWVVYLVQCSDNSLYCGITNDLQRRLNDHNLGKGAKYTRSRTPVVLLGTSSEMTKSEALKLEYRIKRTKSTRKLIELHANPPPFETAALRDLILLQKELQSVTESIRKLCVAVESIATELEHPGDPYGLNEN
jgi:putative endonuclease